MMKLSDPTRRLLNTVCRLPFYIDTGERFVPGVDCYWYYDWRNWLIYANSPPCRQDGQWQRTCYSTAEAAKAANKGRKGKTMVEFGDGYDTETLRKMADNISGEYGDNATADVLVEAAKEIERLAAERTECRAWALKHFRGNVDKSDG